MNFTEMLARILVIAPLVILFVSLSSADLTDSDYGDDETFHSPASKKPRLECFYQKQVRRIPQGRAVRQSGNVGSSPKSNGGDWTTNKTAYDAMVLNAMNIERGMELRERKIQDIIRNGPIMTVTANMEGDIIEGEAKMICYNEDVVDEVKGEHVKLKSDACMAIWTVETDPFTNQTSKKIVKAGCHQSDLGDGINRCNFTECGEREAKQQLCCCNTNMCNSVILNLWIPPPTVPPTEPSDTEEISAGRHRLSMSPVVLLTSVIVVVAVLAGVGFFVIWRFWLRKKMVLFENPADMEEVKLCERFPGTLRRDNPSLDLKTLQLGEKIAQGRFGEVYMALIHGRTVAVKQFVAAQREYFLNECRIFTYPHMDEHDSILKFLGATDRKADLTSEKVFWLIVEYHPNRSLIDYLKSRPVDAPTFTVMAYSLASGLAYLHAEIFKDTTTKPSMAHRDFNSRNVLVREDLRLCICDMGFTMAFQDMNGSANLPHATTKLNDVGTIRYMAPEVLEGNLNLRDSPVALRQVDMYAFGLVLWELAARCSGLYYTSRIPDYQMPYQKEAGLNPTFCEMQTLVAKKNVRPVFPAEWKKDTVVGKFLKALLDELWDTDPEGRLTCGCAGERLGQIANMWGDSGVGGGKGMEAASEPDVVQCSGVGDPDGPTELTGLLHEINATIIPPNKSNVHEMMAVCNRTSPSLAFFSQNNQKYHQVVIPMEDGNLKHDLSKEISTSRNPYPRKISGLKF